MEEKNKQQASAKDTSVRNSVSDLFAFVFSNVKALVDLCRVLGRNISADEIEHLNLQDFLQRTGRYNDTAFHTKDNRLIVFVEHQSTKNKNMPFRFLEYAVFAIKVLEILAKQNRFGGKLMDFPRIEFYVAYNGKTPLEETDKTLLVDLGFIKVTAQVVDIRFDSLSDEAANDAQNAVAGYAYFAKTFGEAKAQGKKPYEAYRFAVDKSIENGYLPEIWSRKECIDMFAETYCYDDQLREEGFELAADIFGELRENVPISQIAEKYGVAIQKIETLKKQLLSHN